MSLHPTAILIHVAEVEEGIRWYSKAFPDADLRVLTESGHAILVLNNFSIEIVSADSKVGAGAHGTVLYWYTDSWAQSLAHLQSLGAELYRGPLEIEEGLTMCQLQDPFGNLIGLRGVAD